MKQATPAGRNDPAAQPAAGADNPLLGLSQAYAEIFGSLGKTLQAMLSGSANPLLDTDLRRMLDPSAWLGGGWNQLDQQLQHLIDRPQFADVAEIDREALKALTIWLELRQVSAEHQLLVWNTWTQAFQRFLGRLAELSAEGKPVTGWQELAALWSEVANRALLEANRSEPFLDVQRRLLKGALRYRAQEREVAEKLCAQTHIPTRSEIDEVHRSIHDMKRELRALKRAVGQSAAGKTRREPARQAAGSRAEPERRTAGSRAEKEPSAAER